jgi:dihydroflavonol-4-reductase
VPAIPKGGTVAVTGAAGFVGGWLTRLLLDHGYRVRACVRDADDLSRTGFLRAMPGHASGRLTLHSADLDDAGCFDSIFPGCHGVAHVSHVSDYDDADAVRAVCDHVIASINASGTVGRVVLTSSIAAVLGEADIKELVRRPVINEDRWPDESSEKRTPERGQGYSIGKVLAEHAFAEAAAEHGGWEAITVCPGDNLGPILSAHQRPAGPWQGLVAKMLEGDCEQTQAYRPWMVVDVRDDALCHLRLLENGEVRNGERYIALSTETRDVETICDRIAELLPELDFEPPEVVDNHPDRVQAREAELRGIWAGLDLRNTRVRAATGVEFRPFDDSLRDTVEALIAVAKVDPVRT